MKTREQLLNCIEDDIELMGEQRIIYLKEVGDQVVDYDYLPSEDYFEAVTLKDLQAELKMLSFAEELEEIVEHNGKKLAVLFPGIGYTCERPLLYYSEQLAKQRGYEIIRVQYSNFPKDVKGNPEKMKESFLIAMRQTKESLKEISWNDYDEILFISKSVGTVVSSAYAKELGLRVKNILFTPVEATFRYVQKPCVIFHGTSDPWASTETILKLTEQFEIPCDVTEEANHSLETGNVDRDIDIIKSIMKKLNSIIR